MSITIYNQMGLKLKEMHSRTAINELDLTAFSEGLYHLVITINHVSVTRYIIKSPSQSGRFKDRFVVELMQRYKALLCHSLVRSVLYAAGADVCCWWRRRFRSDWWIARRASIWITINENHGLKCAGNRVATSYSYAWGLFRDVVVKIEVKCIQPFGIDDVHVSSWSGLHPRLYY